MPRSTTCSPFVSQGGERSAGWHSVARGVSIGSAGRLRHRLHPTPPGPPFARGGKVGGVAFGCARRFGRITGGCVPSPPPDADSKRMKSFFIWQVDRGLCRSFLVGANVSCSAAGGFRRRRIRWSSETHWGIRADGRFVAVDDGDRGRACKGWPSRRSEDQNVTNEPNPIRWLEIRKMRLEL